MECVMFEEHLIRGTTVVSENLIFWISVHFFWVRTTLGGDVWLMWLWMRMSWECQCHGTTLWLWQDCCSYLCWQRWARFWEASKRLIYSGFHCRLPTESAQPALTDVEQIFNSCYIFNVLFLHIFILSYLTLQCCLYCAQKREAGEKKVKLHKRIIHCTSVWIKA